MFKKIKLYLDKKAKELRKEKISGREWSKGTNLNEVLADYYKNNMTHEDGSELSNEDIQKIIKGINNQMDEEIVKKPTYWQIIKYVILDFLNPLFEWHTIVSVFIMFIIIIIIFICFYDDTSPEKANLIFWIGIILIFIFLIIKVIVGNIQKYKNKK